MTWKDIDDLIFDHPTIGLQRVVSILEYYLNISPMTLARICAVVGTGIYVSHYAFLYQSTEQQSPHLIWGVLWFLLLLLTFLALARHESRNRPGTRNVLRLEQVNLRLGDVVLLCLFLPTDVLSGNVWATVGWLGFVLCHYCSACDSLPPTQRFSWRQTADMPS